MPFNVALYSGLYVQADAISTSVRSKVEVLRELQDAGAPLSFTVFTQATDCARPWTRVVETVHQLALHDEFKDADVHVFEFGIRFDLFDAVFVVPPNRTVIAVYHNVTPAHLADRPEVAEALRLSLVQKHNLARADMVACVSEFNRDDLLAFGIAPERLRVLHLPPAVHPGTSPPHHAEVVRLLFVGRFVRAKGVLDLLRAVALARSRGLSGFRLTLAGNALLSAPACLAEMRSMLADSVLQDVVDIVESPDQDELARLYTESDALVIPSYHEGYCMPVIEAMTAGCHVIAYDSGNLPYIVAGLGRMVRAGDVQSLADAIEEFVSTQLAGEHRRGVRQVPTERGLLDEEEWRRAIAAHVAQYSVENYRRGVVDLLAWSAARSPRGAAFSAWLEHARERLTAGAA